MSKPFSNTTYRKNLIFSLGALSVMTVGSAYALKSDTTSNPHLQTILMAYGFHHPSAKTALNELIAMADEKQLKPYLETHFPKQQTPAETVHALIALAELMQDKFTARTGSQERWELKASGWMNDNAEKIRLYQKVLGLIDRVMPKITSVDMICILGSTHSSMSKRLHFAQDLYLKNQLSAPKLLLLAGQRFVTLASDGPETNLVAIAKRQGLTHYQDLTETHLIEDIYQQSKLYKKLNTFVIDTPQKNGLRPTTQTTLDALSVWLNEHPDVRSISFVSSQPHVGYQGAIIQAILTRTHPHISVDVIGPETGANLGVQQLVSALGSDIWAKTPAVLRQLNLKIEQEDTLKRLNALFAKQPLVYQNIKDLVDERNRERKLKP